jgi:hypothetical protein
LQLQWLKLLLRQLCVVPHVRLHPPLLQLQHPWLLHPEWQPPALLLLLVLLPVLPHVQLQLLQHYQQLPLWLLRLLLLPHPVRSQQLHVPLLLLLQPVQLPA